MHPRLILVDRDPAVLEAWRYQFARWPEVEVREGALLDTDASALLLPGNSFGFLDTGLELEVIDAFGPLIEEEVRARIRKEHHGELLVGQALIVRPSGGPPRALVYSPIWRTPRKLAGTVHPFLCLRGALLEMARRGEALDSLAIPPLTGFERGDLDPRIMARQCRHAFEVVTGRRGLGDKNLSQLTRRERKLQVVPDSIEDQGQP
jgi:hypothetical protein